MYSLCIGFSSGFLLRKMLVFLVVMIIKDSLIDNVSLEIYCKVKY